MILLLALIASPAYAGQPEWESGNAVNTCRAAMTFRDIGVRSRPLALVNEGTSGTYINCAFRSNFKDGVIEFGGMLQNYTAADTTVHCTGVIGADDGDASYIVKSIDVPAGTRRYIKWRDSDGFEGNVGFQCYLPAAVGLNELPILK